MVQSNTILEAQLSEIASVYLSLTYNPNLRPYMLKLSTSILIAGQSAFWMGQGRKVVEHSWEIDSVLGIELSGTLCQLNWGGWKMIAAPRLFKNTWSSLETNPERILRLLADLQKDGKLNDVDAVWKEKMQTWVTKRLMTENWHTTEDSVSFSVAFL